MMAGRKRRRAAVEGEHVAWELEERMSRVDELIECVRMMVFFYGQYC